MKADEEGSPQACAVLRALCDWAHPLTPDQIAQRAGLSRTTADLALSGLLERGRVTRDGFGSDALWRIVRGPSAAQAAGADHGTTVVRLGTAPQAAGAVA